MREFQRKIISACTDFLATYNKSILRFLIVKCSMKKHMRMMHSQKLRQRTLSIDIFVIIFSMKVIATHLFDVYLFFDKTDQDVNVLKIYRFRQITNKSSVSDIFFIQAAKFRRSSLNFQIFQLSQFCLKVWNVSENTSFMFK